jgi:hypothetical protein
VENEALFPLMALPLSKIGRNESRHHRRDVTEDAAMETSSNCNINIGIIHLIYCFHHNTHRQLENDSQIRCLRLVGFVLRQSFE